MAELELRMDIADFDADFALNEGNSQLEARNDQVTDADSGPRHVGRSLNGQEESSKDDGSGQEEIQSSSKLDRVLVRCLIPTLIKLVYLQTRKGSIAKALAPARQGRLMNISCSMIILDDSARL